MDQGPISNMVQGPEGFSPEDTRLQELFRHRKALETQPNYRDAENPGFLEEMLPLLLSQGMDLVSTEKALREPGAREANPIPGMGSTAGRIGIQALQAFLINRMLGRSKGLGTKTRDLATAVHGASTLNNLRTSGDLGGY